MTNFYSNLDYVPLENEMSSDSLYCLVQKFRDTLQISNYSLLEAVRICYASLAKVVNNL